MTSGALSSTGYEMCAYTTYGAPTCQSSGAGAPSTPVGYEDGYTDPTGLVYLINRYYDPSLRQFISVDPAYSQTHSLYGYVGSDPVNGSDPSGLSLSVIGPWYSIALFFQSVTGIMPSYNGLIGINPPTGPASENVLETPCGLYRATVELDSLLFMSYYSFDGVQVGQTTAVIGAFGPPPPPPSDGANYTGDESYPINTIATCGAGAGRAAYDEGQQGAFIIFAFFAAQLIPGLDVGVDAAVAGGTILNVVYGCLSSLAGAP